MRAYRHAPSLAEHYRSKLVAPHIVEVWRHPSASFAAASLYQEFRQTLLGIGKEQLQKFVKAHTHNEVQPVLDVGEGMAADSIVSFAHEQKSELIVMGTRGVRGFLIA